MYADVKKSPVEILQAAQYQIFMNEYINYTWFQNDISNQEQEIRGAFLSILDILYIKKLKLTPLEMQHNTTLKFVRIYFDTPTFDKITKDKAVKNMDILSAIGGTMGLLTGFSIISGVEILYYATKLLTHFVIKQ